MLNKITEYLSMKTDTLLSVLLVAAILEVFIIIRDKSSISSREKNSCQYCGRPNKECVCFKYDAIKREKVDDKKDHRR